jgi:hypothetical protein
MVGSKQSFMNTRETHTGLGADSDNCSLSTSGRVGSVRRGGGITSLETEDFGGGGINIVKSNLNHQKTRKGGRKGRQERESRKGNFPYSLMVQFCLRDSGHSNELILIALAFNQSEHKTIFFFVFWSDKISCFILI